MRLTFYSGLIIMALSATIEQPVEALSLAHPELDDNLSQIDSEFDIMGMAGNLAGSVKNAFTGRKQPQQCKQQLTPVQMKHATKNAVAKGVAKKFKRDRKKQMKSRKKLKKRWANRLKKWQEQNAKEEDLDKVPVPPLVVYNPAMNRHQADSMIARRLGHPQRAYELGKAPEMDEPYANNPDEEHITPDKPTTIGEAWGKWVNGFIPLGHEIPYLQMDH